MGKRLSKWSAVRLWWVDSMRDNEWTHVSEDDLVARDKEIEQISVGLVVGETDRVLTICSSYSYNQAEPGVLGLIGIPKVAISKVEVLAKPNKLIGGKDG